MKEVAKSNPIDDRKLRLAIFGGRGMPSPYSGTETFFIELAPRLVERGHDVIVYCRKALFKERPSICEGVRLIYTPSIEIKNLGTFTHTLACMIDVLRRNVDVMLVTKVANAFHCAIPRIFRQNCAFNVDGIEWQRGKWGTLGSAGDRVRFLGRVGNMEHVKELFANANAYIHGHTVGGTNPTLLHALGASSCILARANVFNAEVLGEYGLLFQDADDLAAKIQLIEEQPKLAEEYRRRAPDRIRDVYNWERITDQYEELFYQLAAGEDPTRIHSSVVEEVNRESSVRC
jgi:hypothetical protein